ncbi:MAG: hypothetical protein GY750_01965 [Lentisphaerae bacterium]|nr:hypothetical protein [Lentisphaerota bacterium]MCP4100187.1 hypothetical protein [Lentisphaerota bacterium]
MSSFDAPYITVNSEAIFLASLNDDTDVVYSYKISTRKKLNCNKPCILHEANDNAFDFYDISIAQGTFATRAETADGVMSMFIFDRKSKKLIQKIPDNYNYLNQRKPVILGGPSYFSEKLAFSAYSRDIDNKIISAIYSNAGGNNYAEPVVRSGKVYKSINTAFTYRVRNPTLYLEDDKALIAFMGYPFNGKDATGVYLAKIDKGKVKLSTIAVPGQVVGENMVIRTATIGAVSLRKGIIPLLIKLFNGQELIAVVNLNKKRAVRAEGSAAHLNL